MGGGSSGGVIWGTPWDTPIWGFWPVLELFSPFGQGGPFWGVGGGFGMGRLGLEGDIGGAPTGGHYPGSAHDGRPIMSEGTIRDPGGGTPRRPVSEGIGWWRGVPGGSIFGLKMQENCKVAMKLGPFWGVCTVFWGFSHKFR